MPTWREQVNELRSMIDDAQRHMDETRPGWERFAESLSSNRKEGKTMPEDTMQKWNVDHTLIDPLGGQPNLVGDDYNAFLALRGGQPWERWLWEAVQPYAERALRNTRALRNLAAAEREKIDELVPEKREPRLQEAAGKLRELIAELSRDAAEQVAQRERSIRSLQQRILNVTAPPERDPVTESRHREIRDDLRAMDQGERMRWIEAQANGGNREALHAVIDSPAPVDLVPAEWLSQYRREAAFAVSPDLREMEAGMELLRDRTLEMVHTAHAEVRRALLDFGFQEVVGVPTVESFAGVELEAA